MNDDPKKLVPGSSWTFLDRNDPNTALAAIGAVYPGFSGAKIVAAHQGHDNFTFEVDNEWIFRFPTDAGVRFEAETAVLAFLQGKTDLAIPRVEFLGSSPLFMGYRKLPGIQLKDWDSISQPGQARILDQLTDFMIRVHQNGRTPEGRGLPVRSGDPFPWIEPDRILGTLRRELQDRAWPEFGQRVTERYRGYLEAPGEPILIHHDLHGDNLLYDPGSEALTGVIDLGDVVRGDLHGDFFSFSWVERPPMTVLAEAYTSKTGIVLDHRRIKDYRAMVYLYDACEQHPKTALEDGFGRHLDSELALWAKLEAEGKW